MYRTDQDNKDETNWSLGFMLDQKGNEKFIQNTQKLVADFQTNLVWTGVKITLENKSANISHAI